MTYGGYQQITKPTLIIHPLLDTFGTLETVVNLGSVHLHMHTPKQEISTPLYK